MIPKINIIGAGTVARALGRLWHETGTFSIGCILNQSIESACDAAVFMGAGDAIAKPQDLTPAQIWMIGVPDDEISTAAEMLNQLDLLEFDDLVFHLSGSRQAAELSVLNAEKTRLASLHPLKSFPDPLLGYQTFDRTFCGLEGQERACLELEQHLEIIGARCFRIKTKHKMAYHAANTMVCNYLVSLLDLGLECYDSIGINSTQALEMMMPLMTETLGNSLVLGPQKALTGPVVRGDVDTVRQHLESIPKGQQVVYKALAARALQLAVNANRISPKDAKKVNKLLSDKD